MSPGWKDPDLLTVNDKVCEARLGTLAGISCEKEIENLSNTDPSSLCFDAFVVHKHAMEKFVRTISAN